MSTTFPITLKGSQELKEKLKFLKTVKRPSVISAIAEARAHGDLKENGDYHAAREEQGLLEARILYLDNILENCQVIDIKKIPNEGKAVFGSTVSIRNLDTETEETYQIVGIDEADSKTHKISVVSPMARAMIGKHIGDEFSLNTLTGVKNYELVSVEHL